TSDTPYTGDYKRKNFFAKRRMRAGRCALRGSGVQTSPTLELEETCYAKSPIMFCVSEFDERGIVSPRPGRVWIDIGRWRSIAGSRTGRRFSDAFRYSARSIARQRERDQLTGHR